MTHPITVDDVRKTFGDVVALDGLSMTVERGTTFGLLGTNGAGKSTLFRLLIGHLTPDSGTLRVTGRDVGAAGCSVRRTVGYLPERVGFPPELTGREVLRFHGRMRDLPAGAREDRVDEVLDQVGLASAADRPVSGYSKGMGRRLGLATSLVSRPDLLLLDEPTAGLDPLGIEAFHKVIRDLQENTDLTVMLSTHALAEAETLCDRIGILHDGRLLREGAVNDLERALGTGVTVRVVLEDDADVADVRGLVETRAEIDAASDRTLRAHCPLGAVPDLLDALLDASHVAGFEVNEQDLKHVFVDAIYEATEGSDDG
ncbi:MAG: ABC transporter ATP-binding protein [Haloferacaceae archaeon]